jgi:MYXO-CTERM domain-containing protein
MKTNNFSKYAGAVALATTLLCAVPAQAQNTTGGTSAGGSTSSMQSDQSSDRGSNFGWIGLIGLLGLLGLRKRETPRSTMQSSGRDKNFAS